MVLVAFDEVELLDLASPLQVLTLAGRRWNFRPFKVRVCAPTAGLVQTRNQLRIEAPVHLAEAPEAEILFIPGGYGARKLLQNAEAIAEIARIGRNATFLAAVGWGVAVLARAGLLGEAKIAASADVAELIRESVPNAHVDTRSVLVEESRWLTAAASGAAQDLALALVARTMGPKLLAMVHSELGISSELIDVAYKGVE